MVVASLEKSPRSVAERLGAFYARMLDRALPRLRRTAERNLAMAYPERSDPERNAAWRQRTIDGVFASIGRLLTALARFPRMNAANVRNWIDYEGFEYYQRAKQKGRGVLFAPRISATGN